jgi:dethiobiotin synthase
MSERKKPKGFFITGTDTGIGKTYISRLLADTFAESAPVTYMKPVQTGCTKNPDGSWTVPDYEFVMQGRAKKVLALEKQAPYCFEPACSPHLAAQQAGVAIDPAYIISCFNDICVNHPGLILVEGAGGILVPFFPGYYMLDVMKAMELPIIVVTSPELGTINHTLLSLTVLKNCNLPIAGVIINNSRNHEKEFIYKENIRFIRNFSAPVPVLETEFNASISDALRIFCNELRRNY